MLKYRVNLEDMLSEGSKSQKGDIGFPLCETSRISKSIAIKPTSSCQGQGEGEGE